MDGNNHQIERINAEAENRKVKVTIVVDLIHVMEYIWDAAWCFFAEGDSRAGLGARQDPPRAQGQHP